MKDFFVDNKELNRFDDLLYFIETLPRKDKRRYINEYLVNQRNRLSKVNIDEVSYFNKKKCLVKETEIRNKKMIKSKWFGINNVMINGCYVKDIIDYIYQLDCSESLVICNKVISHFKIDFSLELLDKYFNLNDLFNSLALNKLFFYCNFGKKIKPYNTIIDLNDYILYEYFKKIDRINLLFLLRDRSNGRIYSDLSKEYNLSDTKIRYLVYEGLYILVGFFESDRGLEVIYSLFRAGVLSKKKLSNAFKIFGEVIYDFFKMGFIKIGYDKDEDCFYL